MKKKPPSVEPIAQTTSEKTVELVLQPEAFFYDLLSQSLSESAYRPLPETEAYLVHLLRQFMNTEALYSRDQEGHFKEEPLALMVKDAFETNDGHSQRLMFRQVGDVSLYKAGFFPSSFQRKLVDINYYIQMGGNAYSETAKRYSPNEAVRAVFEELSGHFSKIVDLLAVVSSKTSIKNDISLIQTYDYWQRTKSERAAHVLKLAGIATDSMGAKKDAESTKTNISQSTEKTKKKTIQ